MGGPLVREHGDAIGTYLVIRDLWTQEEIFGLVFSNLWNSKKVPILFVIL